MDGNSRRGLQTGAVAVLQAESKRQQKMRRLQDAKRLKETSGHHPKINHKSKKIKRGPCVSRPVSGRGGGVGGAPPWERPAVVAPSASA